MDQARSQTPERIRRRLVHDASFRKELTRQSLYYFAHVYFSKYITYPTADFQREMYRDLADDGINLLEILAFRGSTKTTLATLILPIWAVLTGRRRYVLLIADTFPQARQYLYNLRTELETNELLAADWGPFTGEDDSDDWQRTTLVIPHLKARVSAHSSGQNMRGLRHLENRPDLVVCDDLENSEGVRQKEQRDKLYNWLKSDVLQTGDRGTKYILIGNLLHSDGIMQRIEDEIKAGSLQGGICRRYPILKTNGMSQWPGKFADPAAVEAERHRIGSERAWQREAMLKIVPDDGQTIHEDWITYYDAIPAEAAITAKAAGVDLAISKASTADYTAVVAGYAGLDAGKPRIWIRPGVVNARLTMMETVERCRLLQEAEPGLRLYVEAVGYQQAAIEEMKRKWLNVQPVQPIGDKRARLETVASYIQSGTVMFPRHGAEDLILQLTHFGTEQHDDMVDALVYLLLGLLKQQIAQPKVVWI